MNLKNVTKKELAKILGISRSLLYYQPKLKDKDWKLKQDIEKVLREFPSYGHKRIAIHLKINKKSPAGNEIIRYQTLPPKR